MLLNAREHVLLNACEHVLLNAREHVLLCKWQLQQETTEQQAAASYSTLKHKTLGTPACL